MVGQRKSLVGAQLVLNELGNQIRDLFGGHWIAAAILVVVAAAAVEARWGMG
jgi:hypothetical protein